MKDFATRDDHLQTIDTSRGQNQFGGDHGLVRVSEWCYHGIWSVLTRWLKVPRDPPDLPTKSGENLWVGRPSLAYLKYLKLQYWISWCVLDLMMFGVVIAAFVAHPLAGIFVLMLALPVIVLPQLWSYVALHLQYDSTWYLLTPRSMRLRRGIWMIKETTITFENVQNVSLQQGPLQRFLGFGNVSVETAGGAAMGPHGAQGGGHHGLLEGLSDAPQVRDLIMQRVRQSQSAGLGDEKIASRSFGKPVRAFTSSQLDLLREIRDLTARLRVS